jgi:DNA polymerase-3 subunit delta
MILFLHGPESYLLREKLQQITERARSQGTDDTNTAQFEAVEAELPALKEALQAAPFLTKQRLVIIRNLLLDRTAEEVEEITTVLENVPETTIAVFCEIGEPDRRRHGFKALTKAAEKTWQLGRLDEGSAVRWVVQRAAKQDINIRPQAASELVRRIGTDLWSLSTELDKLTSAGDGEITEQLIEELVEADLPSDIFAMVDAIGRRDAKTALDHFKRLSDEGEPALRTFAMIIRQFRILLSVQAATGQPPAALARILGLHPFVVQKAIGQAKHFTERELRDIYAELAELDYRFKTGQSEPETAIELFIVELSTKQAVTA